MSSLYVCRIRKMVLRSLRTEAVTKYLYVFCWSEIGVNSVLNQPQPCGTFANPIEMCRLIMVQIKGYALM